jgi:hypothetical protein
MNQLNDMNPPEESGRRRQRTYKSERSLTIVHRRDLAGETDRADLSFRVQEAP